MIRDKRLKVGMFIFEIPMIKTLPVAVTLEGTIIHKSGLITGGRSTHNTTKKWDEKDVQGSRVL